MATVFISYSRADKYFAELLERRLLDDEVRVWRDSNSLLAGEDWRQSIDVGIQNSRLMIVAMSSNSSKSNFVTYEWATAMALKKPIIPVLLESCDHHPKLEPLQYVDFRNHSGGTWQVLIQRVKELWNDEDTFEDNIVKTSEAEEPLSSEDLKLIMKIVGYMNRKGFRMISFDRVRELSGRNIIDADLNDLVERYDRFLPATLSGKRPGLALR